MIDVDPTPRLALDRLAEPRWYPYKTRRPDREAVGARRGKATGRDLPAAVMADAGDSPEGIGDGKGGSQSRPSGSLYLRFIERFASLCHSAGSSSDDSSDSAAPARHGLARRSAGSWISGRLGRSKKGSDQVKYIQFLCSNFDSKYAARLPSTTARLFAA